MRSKSSKPGWSALAILAALATIGGCQSNRHDSNGLSLADELQVREAERQDEPGNKASVASDRQEAQPPRSFVLAGILIRKRVIPQPCQAGLPHPTINGTPAEDRTRNFRSVSCP